MPSFIGGKRSLGVFQSILTNLGPGTHLQTAWAHIFEYHSTYQENRNQKRPFFPARMASLTCTTPFFSTGAGVAGSTEFGFNADVRSTTLTGSAFEDFSSGYLENGLPTRLWFERWTAARLPKLGPVGMADRWVDARLPKELLLPPWRWVEARVPKLSEEVLELLSWLELCSLLVVLRWLAARLPKLGEDPGIVSPERWLAAKLPRLCSPMEVDKLPVLGLTVKLAREGSSPPPAWFLAREPRLGSFILPPALSLFEDCCCRLKALKLPGIKFSKPMDGWVFKCSAARDPRLRPGGLFPCNVLSGATLFRLKGFWSPGGGLSVGANPGGAVESKVEGWPWQIPGLLICSPSSPSILCKFLFHS